MGLPTVGNTTPIRVDHGSEFVSRDGDLWAYQRGAILDFSAWHGHYNKERPHNAIGNVSPIMLAGLTGATNRPDPGLPENSGR